MTFSLPALTPLDIDSELEHALSPLCADSVLAMKSAHVFPIVDTAGVGAYNMYLAFSPSVGLLENMPSPQLSPIVKETYLSARLRTLAFESQSSEEASPPSPSVYGPRSVG